MAQDARTDHFHGGWVAFTCNPPQPVFDAIGEGVVTLASTASRIAMSINPRHLDSTSKLSESTT